MNLILGTVQFGLDYGIAGARRVPETEAHRILSLACSSGVNMLDTAAAYGESEKVIGRYMIDQPDTFRIITKATSLSRSNNPVETLQKCFYDSLASLNVTTVYALMMHDVSDLLGPHGDDIYAKLVSFKEQCLVDYIGISAYSPAEIDTVISRYPIEIVQLPFNVIDQRLLQDDYLVKLKEKGIQIHARSVFLQGLLLLPKERVPEAFIPWANLITQYRLWCSESGLSPVAACLQFVLRQPDIDGVVIGIDNMAQFIEILEAARETGNHLPDASHLACYDEALVNPVNWHTSR